MVGAAPQAATLRSAFQIAWPASLAAIITPLLGLTDVAVLARGSDAQALAGASLAGSLFSLLYWTFGFLRMSLSGLVAQSVGSNDEVSLRAQLIQGAGMGLVIGLTLAIAQGGISIAAQQFFVDSSNASEAAGEAMQAYLRIRIWAAPAAIMTMGILGWLTGQGRTGLLMLVTIGTAGVNAILSIWFVLGLGWGIAGLASATALAELFGLLVSAGCAAAILHRRGGLRIHWDRSRLQSGWSNLLSLNLDILLRTLVLNAIFLSFTRFSADFGDLTLAANHVLLNLVLTLTLLLDGPAIAAETFVGQALGAPRDRRALFEAAWRKTAIIAAVMAAIICASLLVAGDGLLALTVGESHDTAAVLVEARRYLGWATLMPVAVAMAYHLDGVFVGATRADAMRNTMFVAGAIYFGLAFWLAGSFGNHGLWAALLIFMVIRGLALVAMWGGFGPQMQRGITG